MPAFRWSELQPTAFEPEHSAARGPVFGGAEIEAALPVYPAGTEVKRHSRACERVHSVLRGRARYRVGGEERLVTAGQAVLIRPHVELAGTILEELELVAFASRRPVEPPAGGPSAKEAFFTWDEMPSAFITPKYSSARGPTITGDQIEVARFFFPAGTEGKPHTHPNEQIQVVLSGKARAVIEGEEYVLGPGMGILYPVNRRHGAEILEDYALLNCKNIVPGWSVYHARWEK
jgi:quercetin dioxygenase-like cupin family protein